MLRLAVAIWLGLCLGVNAQVVTVRSGEHDGFTRLVLTFPEPAGWDLGRTADGYGFRARKSGWRYDISTVFDLIPRDKVSAVWVDPDSGVLRLGLSCDCHAIATPFRPGIVVIDVLAGAAPTGSPYETALADSGRPMPALVVRKTLRPRQRPPGLVAKEEPTPEMPVAVVPNLLLQGRSPRAMPGPVLTLASPDPRAIDMRDRLLRDLSRSIAAGAVKPVAQLPAPKAPEPASRPVVLPLDLPARESVQLRVRPAGAAPDLALTASGQACISDDRLELAAWGDGRDPADQLVKAQADLLGEFDRPDQERLVALAKLYLNLGFGAEARSLIRLWGQGAPDAVLLDSLGILVDGKSGAPAFAGMLGCDTAAALWSFLAQDRLAAGTDINRAAVLRTFSALPLNLRRLLGPAVSERFLGLGDTEGARAIGDSIGRASGPHGDAVSMIDARLDLADGLAETAEGKLQSIVAEDGATAALALAALIESRISRGEVPDAAQVLALKAMLQERMSSPGAVILRRALAKGQVLTGAADRAFHDQTANDAALYPELWELLARHGASLELAALALDPPGPAVSDLPAGVRIAVAERLQKDGFSEGAGRWVDGVGSVEADLLHARVALDLRDGREALRRLGGQTGPEAEILRAQALTLLGDLPAALVALEAAGSENDAARLRFVARQWDALGSVEDPALRTLLAGRSATPDATQDAPLAQARALMESSSSARAGVTALLAERQVPGG